MVMTIVIMMLAMLMMMMTILMTILMMPTNHLWRSLLLCPSSSPLAYNVIVKRSICLRRCSSFLRWIKETMFITTMIVRHLSHHHRHPQTWLLGRSHWWSEKIGGAWHLPSNTASPPTQQTGHKLFCNLAIFLYLYLTEFQFNPEFEYQSCTKVKVVKWYWKK